MTAQLVWSLQIARSQTLALVSDIPAPLACRQSQPGERHPCWILGHLLLSDTYLLTILDGRALPDDFPALLQKYGPGAAPTSAAEHYDSKELLCDRIADTGSQRIETVRRMSADDLARAMPDPILARMQPTIGQHLHALVFMDWHVRHRPLLSASYAYAESFL